MLNKLKTLKFTRENFDTISELVGKLSNDEKKEYIIFVMDNMDHDWNVETEELKVVRDIVALDSEFFTDVLNQIRLEFENELEQNSKKCAERNAKYESISNQHIPTGKFEFELADEKGEHNYETILHRDSVQSWEHKHSCNFITEFLTEKEKEEFVKRLNKDIQSTFDVLMECREDEKNEEVDEDDVEEDVEDFDFKGGYDFYNSYADVKRDDTPCGCDCDFNVIDTFIDYMKYKKNITLMPKTIIKPEL